VYPFIETLVYHTVQKVDRGNIDEFSVIGQCYFPSKISLNYLRWYRKQSTVSCKISMKENIDMKQLCVYVFVHVCVCVCVCMCMCDKVSKLSASSYNVQRVGCSHGNIINKCHVVSLTTELLYIYGSCVVVVTSVQLSLIWCVCTVVVAVISCIDVLNLPLHDHMTILITMETLDYWTVMYILHMVFSWGKLPYSRKVWWGESLANLANRP